jgi:hypothetical protein
MTNFQNSISMISLGFQESSICRNWLDMSSAVNEARYDQNLEQVVVLSELVLVYWLQDLCSSLIERTILAPVPVLIIHMCNSTSIISL